MSMTPTQRSLAYLRKNGYTVAITERWNAHAGIRQDLFGCIDLIALRGDETLGVQTTSGPNVAARVRKIADNEHLPALRAAGWTLHVHGWSKPKGSRFWMLRTVDVS